MPRALRLAWAAPPGVPPAAWLPACGEALAALRASPQATPGHAGSPGAACDIGFAPPAGAAAQPRPGLDGQPAPLLRKVHLGPAPLPHPADRTPAWWLTDGRGRPLDTRRPLLADISCGRGLALALWQPHPQGDGWVCLRRLHIDTSTHHGQAMAALPGAVAQLLCQAGRDLLLAAGAAGADAGAAPPAPVYARPCGPACPPRATARASRRWPALLLLLRGRWLAWAARQRARWQREEWRIGIVDQPLAALTQPGQRLAPQWLASNGESGYWADPAAQAGSDSRILVEYFDEHRRQGHIEQLRLNGQHGITERQVLPLGRGRHASFPLAFQMDGRWLGLAETSALRRCELHEIDAQGRWRLLATLLPGVAAADPALFQWQGRYWLACTDIDRGAMDNLCLFHADRPEGPWLPHANNPVKTDVTGARMAGAFFWHEGQLYRPAQNCLGSYGAGLVLHRVLHCSPTHYAEEPVRRFDPDPHGPCPHGLHTLNAWGNRTLVDGKRHVFSLQVGLQKLRRRLAGGPAAAQPARSDAP